MFANRFTAVLDACILASALKRNIILSLAKAELFRPRWSVDIMNETERAIAKIIKNQGLTNPVEKAKKARKNIERAFEDANIEEYDILFKNFEALPDKDDAHVIAVAVKTKASIIVTDNIKDFPKYILDALEMEAKSADDFIADTFDLSLSKALSAVKDMRARLKNPDFTTDSLLIRMEKIGLPQAADILRENQDLW
ncbi:MAG: PIN domain-containing protein [Rhodobacteraceae bacterium]|nr:PIN domain-containing protein [Paracoccaceae bacterium]